MVLKEVCMSMEDSSKDFLIEAHIRNLKIQIVRLMLRSGKVDTSFLEQAYSEDQIRKRFYFRKKDICTYINEIFDGNEPRYTFKEEIKKDLQSYFKQHNNAEQEYLDIKNKFLDKCEAYLKKVEADPRAYETDSFAEFKSEIDYENTIAIIHWGSLPIYKSEYIRQEELIPEKDILGYYNNFYTLKDLVKWIKNEEKWKPSFRGDCNLDQVMNFSVYTRRWGHEDCYRIKRTINGWYIQAIAINGDSKKNGEGKILENLNHDYIFYYKSGVKEAFEYLWNMADEHEMAVSELAKKLQNIADWISGTEKACEKYKPDWLSEV